MLTPIEIQGITFKTGRGYKKDDVDSFMKALHHDYEIMYKENKELKDKVATLSDGVQYYKNLEKTLQKALVLAEKTSEETKAAAQKEAETIEKQARLRADKILLDAKQELDRIEAKTQELLQNFELYRAQFRQVLSTQMELVNSSRFDIQKKEFVLFEEKKDEVNQVEPELKKALDIDKAEVKASEEEVLQAEKLADQVKEETAKLQTEKEEETLDAVKESEQEAAAASERNLEKELANSVEAIEKETNAKKTVEDSDTETDLEIKMLQKLLNEIKKNSDSSESEEEFEFIDTESEE